MRGARDRGGDEVAAISDLRKRVAQLEAFGAAYSAPPPPPPERARAAADPAWAKAAARGEVEMDVPSYEHSMEARQKWRESAAGKAAREKAAPPAAEADGRAEATALCNKAKAEADAFEAGDNADGVDAPPPAAAGKGTARLCVVVLLERPDAAPTRRWRRWRVQTSADWSLVLARLAPSGGAGARRRARAAAAAEALAAEAASPRRR